MAMNPRPADLTAEYPITFFTTEDGDPWAIFCWGEAPPEAFTIAGMVEAIVYHGALTRSEAQELIGLGIDPVPMWIRHDGAEDDGYAYRQCDKNHPDAQRITGARF